MGTAALLGSFFVLLVVRLGLYYLPHLFGTKIRFPFLSIMLSLAISLA